MSRFTKRPRLLMVTLGVLAALVLAESVALAATVVKKGGAVTSVRVAAAGTYSGDQATVSQANSWTDITGMSVTMSVPSGQSAIFLATFSATTLCQDGSEPFLLSCYVRVLVDDVEASPGVVIFDAAPDGNTFEAQEANSMQFVAGPISSGPHTVKVQGFIGGASSAFTLWTRTLTVMRMPAK